MQLLIFKGRRLSVRTATAPVGPWPALDVAVNPACPADIVAHEADLKACAGDPAKAVGLNAAFFARHIEGWSATLPGTDATPAVVAPETVAALPLPVFNQLYDIVCGFHEAALGNSEPSSGSSPAPLGGSAPAPTAG